MEAQLKQRRGAIPALAAVIKANAVAVTIVVAGLAIAGGFLLRKHYMTPDTAATGVAQAAKPVKPIDIASVNQNGVPFLGKVDAPVVVAYWYDYQCPYCKKMEAEVLPRLLSDYVDTGKVKLLFKGYPTLGDDSRSAALAERAIWEKQPEKFLQWHQQMFIKQDDENRGWGNRKDIVALMSSVGMNGNEMDKFVAESAQKNQQALMADMQEAEDFGLTGTPSIIVGKKSFVGSKPYSDIKAAIDEELKK